MFHVHAIHLTFGVNERKLAKRLDVAVKMEPSTKPNSFLLQIISYEKNAGTVQTCDKLPTSLSSCTTTIPLLAHYQVTYMNSEDNYYVSPILMGCLLSVSGNLSHECKSPNILFVIFDKL